MMDLMSVIDYVLIHDANNLVEAAQVAFPGLRFEG
jgi:hypothetical protein